MSPGHFPADAFMSVSNDAQESYQKDGTCNVSTFNFYFEYVRLLDDRRILVQGIGLANVAIRCVSKCGIARATAVRTDLAVDTRILTAEAGVG